MLPIIKSGRIPPHPRMLCAQIRYKLTKLLASLQSLDATAMYTPEAARIHEPWVKYLLALAGQVVSDVLAPDFERSSTPRNGKSPACAGRLVLPQFPLRIKTRMKRQSA